MKYTFTFSPTSESQFRSILSRLDPDEFRIIQEITLVEHKPDDDIRYVDRQMIIEMEPEAALTLRLGMKTLKIRRERTEEELTEEKEINDRNTVKVTVFVPPGNSTP